MKVGKSLAFIAALMGLLGFVVGGQASGLMLWQQRVFGDWQKDVFVSTRSSVPGIWVPATTGDYLSTDRVTDQVAFDVDGDGDVDLATTGWEDNHLFLNDGSGNLQLAEAGDFDEPTHWAIALIAFDADNDGDKDLAVVEEHGPSPNQLFLNDGSGNFTRVEAGDFDDQIQVTYSVLSFDADNDGDMDLAIAQREADLLFLNNGAARFTQVDSGDFDDCPCPETFALVAFDADGDGDIDLARGGRGSDKPNALFINDGHGLFSWVDSGDFGSDLTPTTAISAFDVDGDGDSDLVVGKGDSTLSFLAYDAVYLNDGNGKFHLAEGGDFDDIISVTSALASLDVDEDGDLDLAVAYGSDVRLAKNAFFINDGKGRFWLYEGRMLDYWRRWTKAVTAFDVDGDGDMDLSFGNGHGPQHIYFNQQRTETCVTLDIEGFAVQATGDFGRDINMPGKLGVTLDVDNDGDVDLVSHNAAGRLVLYKNDGTGQMYKADAGDLEKEMAETRSLIAFDADNDGDEDIVIGNFGQPNRLFLNDGKGWFRLGDAGDFDNLPLETTALAAFDVDGDGDQDLLTSSRRYPVELYINDGQGFFQKRRGTDFVNTYRDNVTLLIPLDADSDGDKDVIVLGNGFVNDMATLYLNDGLGRFQVSENSGLGVIERFRRMQAYDLNSDGFADLVSTHQVFLNDGEGVFHLLEQNDVFAAPDTFSKSFALLDADNDGDMDLIRSNIWTPGFIGDLVQLFLNDGEGRFDLTDAGEINNASFAGDLLSADVNGDDKEDVIGLGGQDQGIYKNQGDATFALLSNAGGIASTENRTYDLKTADVNGDGLPDLITGEFGMNLVFWGDGQGSFQQVEAGDFTRDNGLTRALAIFDADGDGDMDIVTGNEPYYGEKEPRPNSLYLNNGQGEFTRVDAGELDDKVTNTVALAAFDVDGDGDIDIAEGNYEEKNRLLLNDGNGRFTQMEAGQFDDRDDSPIFLLPFDADGDGDVDLLAADYPDRLYKNDGSGRFSSVPWTDHPNYFSFNAVAFDMDNDGDLDLVLKDDDSASTNRWYLNDGKGFFTKIKEDASGQLKNFSRGLAVLDVDNDNDFDLADGLGRVYLNKGDGYFSKEPMGDFSNSVAPRDVILSLDVDGDGDTDLVTAGRAINLIFFNQGLYEQGSLTSPPIDPQEECSGCGNLLGWKSFNVDMKRPHNTQLTFDILDARTDQPILGYENRSLDDDRRIDLSDLDAEAFPSIRLRARFANLAPGVGIDGPSPQLCGWFVTFYMDGMGGAGYLPLIQRH